MPRLTGTLTRSSSQSEQDKIDHMEKLLRDKMEVASGFASPEVRNRHLIQCFKFFDTNQTGFVNYSQFFAGMTKLNFIGCQREIESLFNRYDMDASGSLSYIDFSNRIFGVGAAVSLDKDGKRLMENLRQTLVTIGSTSALHTVSRLLSELASDSRQVNRFDIEDSLRLYGVDMSATDIQLLFNYYDKFSNEKVDIDILARDLKSGMSFERKLLVKDIFSRLDKDGTGAVSVNSILSAYDVSGLPSVVNGYTAVSDATQDILRSFQEGADPNGRVYWSEFLDYFRGISLAIEDDKTFELMLRNTWTLPETFGVTCTRRVLVKYEDGSQEVLFVNSH